MGFQHETPCSKLRWFYQYFGVRGNYKVLEVVYEYAAKAWKRWLGERHRDGRISHGKQPFQGSTAEAYLSLLLMSYTIQPIFLHNLAPNSRYRMAEFLQNL
jgi:hypothetical protein